MSSVAHPPVQDAATIRERLRTATEFDPERAPRLLQIAESWAQFAAMRFATVAGVPTTVEFARAETEPFPDPEEAEAKDRFYCVLTGRRLPSPGYVVMQKSGLEGLYGVFFGAEAQQGEVAPRELTALDRSLVKLAFEAVSDPAGMAFSPVADLHVSGSDLVEPAALAVELGAEEGETLDSRFVMFRFTLSAASQSCEIAVGLPEVFFTPYRRALGVAPEAAKQERDESWSEAIKESFAQSDLRVEAILDKTKIPLSQIASFRVGETIELSIDANSLITVACQEHPLFRARMGRSRDNYVVKIEERIDPTEDFIDGILSH